MFQYIWWSTASLTALHCLVSSVISADILENTVLSRDLSRRKHCCLTVLWRVFLRVHLNNLSVEWQQVMCLNCAVSPLQLLAVELQCFLDRSGILVNSTFWTCVKLFNMIRLVCSINFTHAIVVGLNHLGLIDLSTCLFFRWKSLGLLKWLSFHISRSYGDHLAVIPAD